MKFGLTYFSTAESIHPARLGPAMEVAGFESLWAVEHSHIPVSDAMPGRFQEATPGVRREYYETTDPFVSLSIAAAVTTKLRLATGVCLVPQRNPFQTAKSVASLDVLSGGRVLFGVGAGWYAPEIENHGVVFAERFAVMREHVEAMKCLWMDEQAEYVGSHVNFGPAYAWPKPSQKPYPQIHMGGGGLTAIRRAVGYCDAWVPLWEEGEQNPLALIPTLRDEVARAGRDADGFEVSIFFCPPDRDTIERCREAGVTRVLLPMPALPENESLEAVARMAELIDAV